MCAEDSKASDLKLRTIVNLKTDISILIDSHLDKRGLETLTKNNRKVMARYNVHGNFSKLRGVSIFIKRNIGVNISNVELIDATDTVLFTLTNTSNESIDVVAVYGPSREDSPAFFEKAADAANSRKKNHKLILGDFNTTMSVDLDQYKYEGDPHGKSRELLGTWDDLGHFHDVFRTKHPMLKNYTWRQKDGSKKGRIDMAMASPGLLNHIVSINHVAHPFKATDHSSIVMQIDFELTT
jgi:exonuclease III